MQTKSELQTVLESLCAELDGKVSEFDGEVLFTSKSNYALVLAALVRAVGLGTASVDTVEEAVRVHRTLDTRSNRGNYMGVYFPGFAYTRD